MKRLSKPKLDSLGGGVILSLALHALVLGALLVSLPAPEAEPEPEEQVVEVTLVEPPEPEQATPPEPEAAPEPPPELEAAPEPPAPEPPAPEPETTPPAPEAEAPPPAPQAEAPAPESVPIPVLRPVLRFGEEDSGPKLSPDGDSAEEPAATETPKDAADPEAPLPVEAVPEQPESQEPETRSAEDVPSEAPVPSLALPELALPEADLSLGGEPEPGADPAPAALPETSPGPDAPEDTNAAPDAQAPAPDAAPSGDTGLAEAGELFSPNLTQDRAAMVAMGSLPREMRASQLCASELQQQLRNATPPYGLELLPTYQLRQGNVLAVDNAAFRADGAWYDLSFRCTVDDDALQVLSFAHRVGQPIPRDEWRARGFPDF
ncbi:DUF930 domain-containing protein [Hoeflea olei]|uniref:DUF930 domain-containing protein n=1 Tax=Hoeflea olei TaxID=1480615 RepID=A0A1C1YUX7_9HYPH|nr:DUF930 domain-containing protein [Hoeflea olei]OCW57237.1 hypothetical protein AWJ14_13055 [Hoeflea olei]